MFSVCLVLFLLQCFEQILVNFYSFIKVYSFIKILFFYPILHRLIIDIIHNCERGERNRCVKSAKAGVRGQNKNVVKIHSLFLVIQVLETCKY